MKIEVLTLGVGFLSGCRTTREIGQIEYQENEMSSQLGLAYVDKEKTIDNSRRS